jgi:hypothetical protein
VINTAERAIGVSPQVSIIPRPHKHVRVPLVLQLNRIVDPRLYLAAVRTALTKSVSAVLEAISCSDRRIRRPEGVNEDAN